MTSLILVKCGQENGEEAVDRILREKSGVVHNINI